MQDKLQTYIGFCKRARKITYGSFAIGALKDGVYLLILDGTAAQNSVRYALKYKNKFNCPLLVCKSRFGEIANRPECKLAAIRDKNLAAAIINCNDDDCELYVGGSEE